MRLFAAVTATLVLSACAAPEHDVALNNDPLTASRQGESLGEQMVREGQGDGCLVAGNAGRNRDGGLIGGTNRCQDLRDVIAPPEPPPGIEIAPPPPPPPSRDD